jgi:hypothetical protein
MVIAVEQNWDVAEKSRACLVAGISYVCLSGLLWAIIGSERCSRKALPTERRAVPDDKKPSDSSPLLTRVAFANRE